MINVYDLATLAVCLIFTATLAVVVIGAVHLAGF
jgi:hypothetical protein